MSPFLRIAWIAVAIAALAALPGCDIRSYPYYLQGNHGLLWVADSADNTVTCISRTTDRTLGTFEVGPNPSRTAVDLLGNCWVGSRDDDTVWYITRHGRTKKYRGFSAARGVALDRDGNVWIANSGNSTIQRIDAGSGRVSEQVPVAGASYLYGALVDGNNMLWIADYSRAVYRYDISQFPSAEAFESVAVNVYGITVDFDGTVWAAGPASGAISRIDPVTLEVTTTASGAGMLSGTTVDINNRIWFCNDNGNSLLRYDPLTEEILSFPVDGTRPHGVAADEEGFVYSINMESDSISKMDVETGEVVHQYETGRTPYTYSDLTGFIYRKITLGL